MYKKALDELLNKGFNLKSTLLYGEEPYYINEYSKKIADIIDPQKDNRLIYYFDEYNFEGAKNYLSQSSLFGDINLLIIKHDKEIAKKEMDILIDLCIKNQNSFFIYELYSRDAKKISKSFSKNKQADFVRFFKPTLYEAKEIISNFAKQKGIQIDEFSINHLLLSLDLNLELAKKELEKISILTKNVGNKEIDELAYSLTPLNLEKFYIYLLEKKPINEILKNLEYEDINELKILLGFENFLQQLFMFHSFIKINGFFDSKEVLGYKLPPQIEKQRVALAMKLKERDFLNLFKELQNSELYLKTKTDIDRKSYLFSSLIKIQALI
ncbi:DNA polymerase III subunit delta [Nitrosophilus kaiyonis]|uniref:DNA polymerase III subunit delta n=1 Tax=Nitrosophilus kaiyonis TaxID=2930200 RepID=UPI002491F931|nr:DNA polymerase III subunit delta [Nitrosophilus kaiyonis]